MKKMARYQLVYKQAGIQPEESVRYINDLKEETLDFITKRGFDRRIIKPIMNAALEDMRENPEMEFDQAVNDILNNKNRMMAFMKRYCL